MSINCFVFALASIFCLIGQIYYQIKLGGLVWLGIKHVYTCFLGLRNGGMVERGKSLGLGVKGGRSGPASRCELPVACHFISGSSSVKWGGGLNESGLFNSEIPVLKVLQKSMVAACLSWSTRVHTVNWMTSSWTPGSSHIKAVQGQRSSASPWPGF